MAEDTPSLGTSRLEPLSVVWRVLAAPQTFLILLGLVALALALGTLIPQIPPQATSDPQAWLAIQPGPLGERNGLIRALGLYDLYRSFGFRALLALTGLVLFVRIFESAETAWRVTAGKPWPADAFALWGNNAPRLQIPVSLSADRTRTLISEFLTEHGYRWARVYDAPAPSLVASRRAPIFWARPLAYTALLLAMIGVVVTSTWGWQGEVWQPFPGESQSIGGDLPYTLRLDAFSMQFDGQGRLQGYQSQVTWLQGDGIVEQDLIGIGQPATLGGVSVRQLGYVPVVKMQGRDLGGRPLTFQADSGDLGSSSRIEIRFASPDEQPFVYIASHDRFLALTFEPLCDQDRPALHVDLIDDVGAERQRAEVLYGSGSLAVGELQLEVELGYVPILRSDFRPAMSLVILGLVLVIAALALSWVASPWLLWFTFDSLDGDADRVQVLSPSGGRERRWLGQLADGLREVLAHDA